MEEATLLVATVALHQFITTVFTLFNDVPTAHEMRMDTLLRNRGFILPIAFFVPLRK
jgi:hypothetical protein